MKYILIVISTLVNSPLSGCEAVGRLQALDQILRGYDRRATPSASHGNATKVGIEFYLRSFGSIDHYAMNYQVDLFLHQTWQDPRLAIQGLQEPMDLNDPNLIKAIWKPEVYFPNAQTAEFQYVTVPNVLVRISPGGNILYMLRLKVVFSCPLDLSWYPLDSQLCTMEIAGFSKTRRELELVWGSAEPVRTHSGLRMNQFVLGDIVAATCDTPLFMGNYSCLVAEFHLSRSIGFHLVQTYLPTSLVVVISWVSFWMDVDAVPGRITLGITTLLTVTTKTLGVQMGLPPVSYAKAIDLWMGACTAFVFLALLEFLLVNFLFRRCNHALPHDADKTKEDQLGKALRIDEASRILFPILFALFNLSYWCSYLA